LTTPALHLSANPEASSSPAQVECGPSMWGCNPLGRARLLILERRARFAKGQPVRPAQHSTDGFWTIDVKIITLAAASSGGTAEMIRPTYLRLEVEPGNRAHEGMKSAHTGTLNAGILPAFRERFLSTATGRYEAHPMKLWLE